jgi:LysR family transcriptional regulator for bpeEF and oprC
MDKLRAMQYFTQVVESGSFAGAARELEVSPPAVTQMVAALEKLLGTTLLVRGARGVSLTRSGEDYYRFCARTIADVRAAESRARHVQPSGVLRVGMPRRIVHNCVMAELHAFLHSYPGLKLDLRSVHMSNEPAADLVDVMVLHAWEHYEDLVAREIVWTRFLTCAAPSYWRAHGVPREPEELERHACLVYRTTQNVVLDEWTFRRGNAARAVRVRPHIIFDDSEALIEAGMRGYGIVRPADLVVWSRIKQGLLVPGLVEWEATGAPPVRFLYRKGVKPSPAARAFTRFIEDLFARFAAERRAAGYSDPQREPPPLWFQRANRFPPGSARRLAAQ